MSAARELIREATLGTSPGQIAWFARHVERQRGRWEMLSPDDRAEVEAIEAHLARHTAGVADIGPAQRVAAAKRAYSDAILKGDAAAAAEAKQRIASLRAEQKIAREIQRGAPARAAIRAAAADAARAETERREAERVKAQSESDTVARELASAIVALHRLHVSLPERCPSRPAHQVWALAAKLVGEELRALPANVLPALASALHASTL